MVLHCEVEWRMRVPSISNFSHLVLVSVQYKVTDVNIYMRLQSFMSRNVRADRASLLHPLWLRGPCWPRWKSCVCKDDLDSWNKELVKCLFQSSSVCLLWLRCIASLSCSLCDFCGPATLEINLKTHTSVPSLRKERYFRGWALRSLQGGTTNRVFFK